MLLQVQVSCRYAKEKSLSPLVLIIQDKCKVLTHLKNSTTDLSTTKSVATTLQTEAAFEFFLHPLVSKSFISPWEDEVQVMPAQRQHVPRHTDEFNLVWPIRKAHHKAIIPEWDRPLKVLD